MSQDAVKWLKHLQNDAGFYRENIERCSEVQSDLLFRMLSHNQDTEYGKKHSFGDIRSYEDFCQNVPLVSYEDLEGYIEKIKAGCPNILTSDEVIRFEKTSGSTGKDKLIPYTNGLISDFQKGVASWMHSLVQNKEEVFGQKFYLALSPKLMRTTEGESAIKIGSGDDLAYFDEQTAMALFPCIVIPETNACKDDEEFYKKIVLSLMRENISLISCWSPTYLLQIDSLMRRFLNGFNLPKNFVWKDIWPDLQLVSCWTDASSGLFISELKSILGEGVEVQGKGLMSTESICSIPYIKNRDPVLSYTSHFYEFENEDGEIFRAHELEQGKKYVVIVTTNGGLYRYRTGDCIEVGGFYKSIPSFRFTGRAGRVSDLVGEKLSEAQVNEAFKNLCLPPVVLVAEKDHYVLVSTEILSDDICLKLDDFLSRNCYYEQARKLGQLKDIRTKIVNKEDFNGIQKMVNGKKIQDTTLKFHPLVLFSERQSFLSKGVY